jgi:hypothetical protein
LEVQIGDECEPNMVPTCVLDLKILLGLRLWCLFKYSKR